MRILFFFIISFFIISCNNDLKKPSIQEEEVTTVFSNISKDISGIDFINKLNENDTLNYFTYPYIYMGGGVSVGDINNDGLDDIFFTGNMVPNKLFLNLGNLKFKDISETANIEGDSRWYTGTTMADVNGDGLLDIYASVAGQSENLSFKENQLFINNGDLTFTEKAKDYGLNDKGQSVNATFLDYDNDGDLDVYIANYPRTPFQASTLQYKQLMYFVTDLQSDQLYRNDGEHFTKVTEQSGVKQYNLSLSATAADFNNDGWPDIYVSSDFNSPDSFYLNMKDGTFKNIINESVNHTSFYGMGVDAADINNDCLLDIIQMDMDAASNVRSKANMASMNPKLFKDIEKAGFKTQFMQNSLQLNNGISKKGYPKFSDISRISGVSSTDWSWAPLIADFDNDGFKDIFISNGTRREINNKDYFGVLNKEKRHKDSLLTKTLNMPSEAIENFIFSNNKDLTFKKKNSEWGILEKTFSNGSSYSDLDNDGDLELIVNNIDAPASIYNNNSDNNYIKLQFADYKKNTFGLGTKATLFYKDQKQYQELTLSRGFQSSVSPKLNFGLDSNINIIDSIKVQWPNNRITILKNVVADTLLTVNYSENTSLLSNLNNSDTPKLFNSSPKLPFKFKHTENEFDDFNIEVLLPHKTSSFGPNVSVGDLNGDGKDDFFMSGSFSYSSAIFFQNDKGGFTRQNFDFLKKDAFSEDLGSLIFDADNDGDNDIYVVSGGNEFSYLSKKLQDRLYINNGSGNFIKSENSIPSMITSGQSVIGNDFDKDGDIDLFISGRLVPGNYPYPANSYLLENVSKTGKPKFIDVTETKASFLQKLGLATSASFTDINSDGWEDLVVVGEWMPIKIFINEKGNRFSDKSKEYGLSDTSGWWFSVKSADFDKDGDQDLIVGNLGLNYKYKADTEETFDIYFNDFDGNKKNDIVLSYFNDGKKYPVRGRECSSQQIPTIKKKFKDYDSFSKATLEDVYGEKLNKSLHYSVKSFSSIYLENKGGSFKTHKLPNEAQISPINQILIDDFDNDSHIDILVAGNLYGSEVETPRADAGRGLYLKGDSKGNFKPLEIRNSGLNIDGDTKDLDIISIQGNKYIIASKNNDYIQFIKINNNNK